MLKKNKKTISFIGIFGMVFLQIMPICVQAATVSSSVTTGSPAASTDTTSIADVQATVENKIKGPTVDISFASDNFFKEGSKVTATATTSGFYDSSDKLYYTWYIEHVEHDGCELDESPSSTKQDSCDLDGDGEITVNDWKITATRLIVQGNFDRKSDSAKKLYDAGETGTIEKGSGTEAVPGVTDSDDSWRKNFARGGNGDLYEKNGDGAPNCYVQEPVSGVIYELRGVTPDFSANADSCSAVGYLPACVKDSTTTCTVLNPAFDPNNSYCWPETANPFYDPVLCTEPKSITQSFNTCAVNATSSVADMADEFKCTTSNSKTFEAAVTCKKGGTPMCVKTAENTKMVDLTETAAADADGENTLGVIFKEGAIDVDMCSVVAAENEEASPANKPPNFLDNLQPLIDSSHEACSYLSDGLINGITQDATLTVSGLTVPVSDLITVVAANANLNLSCTFGKEDDGNICKHLFPYFPKKDVTVDGEQLDLFDNAKGEYEAAGDGEFSLKEKQFWWANPAVVSTNETGIPDETSVIGLGIDSMSWTYSPGDKIGVVVEGTTNLATEHEDASYRTMWAFSQNTCPELEDVGKSEAFYTELGGDVGIRTTDFDLDKCLKDNLEVPSDSGSTMGVTLTSSPSNPINDTTGINGDSVRVFASVDNVTEVDSIYYDWSIELSSSGDTYPNENTDYTDITQDMITTSKSLTSSDTQGLGKNELNFLLNLPDTIINQTGSEFYLRVRVTATENSGDGNQTSTGVLIIKVQQQEYGLEVYSVTADSNELLSLSDDPVCMTPEEQATCEVAKNQIIGIKVNNADNDNSALSGFTWTVNDVAMSCDSNLSSACSNGASDTLFVPILGNTGESVKVTVNAASADTGGTTEVTRFFNIVAPYAKITSADNTNAWPKLLGYYIDLEGEKTADHSSRVFETNSGKNVTFTANVIPQQGSNFTWMLDGIIQDDNNSGQLAFPIEKTLGEVYNINLTVNMVDDSQIEQINNLRRVLRDRWGIGADYSAPVDNISANIQLNVTDTSPVTVAKANNKGIFASLITNLPENLMFLLRIALTSFVLMFSVSLLFAFIPESIFEKNE